MRSTKIGGNKELINETIKILELFSEKNYSFISVKGIYRILILRDNYTPYSLVDLQAEGLGISKFRVNKPIKGLIEELKSKL